MVQTAPGTIPGIKPATTRNSNGRANRYMTETCGSPG